MSHLPLAFLVFIVDFEQVKIRLGSKKQRSRKPWHSSFIVPKKRFNYCSQRRTQNLWHIQNWSFGKNSSQFKVLNNFNMKLHFKIHYSVLNLRRVFFWFTFSIDLSISLNILLKLIERQVGKCLCSRYILEGVHCVWELSKCDSRDTTTMFVM